VLADTDWSLLPDDVHAVINAYPDTRMVSFELAVRPTVTPGQRAEIMAWAKDRCQQYAAGIEREPLWRWHNLEAVHQLVGRQSTLIIGGG